MSIYGKTYRGVLWPLYETLRGRQTPRLRKAAEHNQWKTPSELHALQWTELQKLLHHAYAHSPFYRKVFDQLDLPPTKIRTPEEYARLPCLTKDDIRQHREEMLASQFRGRMYEHKTGGSTGVPLQFYINYGSYEWRRAVTLRGYGWAGCEEADRSFYVWGAPIGTPPWKQRLKTSLHHAVLGQKVFSSFRFSETAMQECARQINAFKPGTIVGYTNALYLLAQFLIEHKLAAASPQAVITAAEAVNPVQRQVIEQAFGAPVFGSYGSREFMLLAMECNRHQGLHISSDNVYLEVVTNGKPVAPGEHGEILITDLHNYAMPFIRYKIGDVGLLTSTHCSCGRGLPMLDKVEGRVLDIIRTADGRIIPGEFFPHLMKEFSAVKQFQVVQKRIDLLQIKLVLRDGEYAEQLRGIRQEIGRVVGDAITVNLERVDEIPQSDSGKFRVTVSEIVT